MESIAIIGSGISGLGCAWYLHREYQVTVFEADQHIGGHANTVHVSEEDRRIPIDTGFMVFNHVTYPNLSRLFRELSVPIKPTDMSFSVRHETRRLEFRGTSLNHLFAQRRNLLRPSFYRMLRQIDRFNQEAVEALRRGDIAQQTLDEYVASRGYGADFLELYLIPMSSAVWSAPRERMLSFPAATLLRFFHNHGFLGLHTQHPWWTVDGGSCEYVSRLIQPFRERIHTATPVRQVRRDLTGVEVVTDHGPARFDHVIFACHPPTALKLLGSGATEEERRALLAFRYQPNVATLHTDARVMPQRKLAWSAWNYLIDASKSDSRKEPQLSASTHYWMNRLQGVSDRVDYFVSIGAEQRIDPTRVVRTIAYEHPLFDLEARAAQTQIMALNAHALASTYSYFVGAWQGYGFHEDGLASAVALSRMMLARDPWTAPKAVEVA